MKEKFNKLCLIFYVFYVWTIGLLGGSVLLLLRILKRVEIKGYEKWKSLPLLLKKNLRLLVVSNHPSLWEPLVLPFLFLRWYLFYPSLIPFSTPDKKNYYDKWWFSLFRPVSIPIVRETKKGEEVKNREEKRKEKHKSLKELVQKIRERRLIILFPEGGRTFKGGEYKIIRNDGKIVTEKRNWQAVERQFPGMPKIRRFQKGVKGFLKRTQIILPIWIWIERKKRRLKIKIGRPIEKVANIDELEDNLLKLGAV